MKTATFAFVLGLAGTLTLAVRQWRRRPG